jgi:hypothetical protein
VILAGRGLRLELPAAWSGRIFSAQPPAATLHAANYPLPLDDGAFGDASTAAMRPGMIFLALTEYQAGAGLEPGVGLFAERRPPRRLDPAAFRATGLAHPRPGQVGAQRFFTAAGRPLCLYVVLAGPRALRRGQLAAVGHVLRRLEIAPRDADGALS